MRAHAFGAVQWQRGGERSLTERSRLHTALSNVAPYQEMHVHKEEMTAEPCFESVVIESFQRCFLAARGDVDTWGEGELVKECRATRHLYSAFWSATACEIVDSIQDVKTEVPPSSCGGLSLGYSWHSHNAVKG